MKRVALCLAVAAAGLSSLGACGVKHSIGKGDYSWIGGSQSRIPPGLGALRVTWRKELTLPARGAYRPVEHAVAAIDDLRGRLYVGAESGNLHALAFDGRQLYRFELHEPIECEPALDVATQELYIGTERGEFYALAADEGKILWKKEGDAAIRQQPKLLDDAVFVFTEEDVIEAYARADGRVLWRYSRDPLEGFLVAGHSGLTLTEDKRLLAGFSDGVVVALDALDGRVKWERNTAFEVPETEPGRPRYTDVDTTPVVLGESVYIASFGAGLYALDANNGSVLWREADWTGITSLKATPDGLGLIVISAERGIARFDLATRAATWQRNPERGYFGVPEIYDDMIVIGDSRGSLVALDVQSGDEVGRLDSGHGFVARATFESGRGFVVTNGGVLLSLRASNPLAEAKP